MGARGAAGGAGRGRGQAECAGTPAAPHPDTVVRLLAALGAQSLADCAGAFLARRDIVGPVTLPVAGPGWLPAVAVDGKAVRGAAGPDGLVPYLLAAAAHGAGTWCGRKADRPEDERGPRIRAAAARPERVLLPGRARHHRRRGHTVRAHAKLICEEFGAYYVFTVKQTPRRYGTTSMPWTGPPCRSSTRRKKKGTGAASAAPSRS